MDSLFRSLPALKAKPGVTALSGQVLLLNGKPLADVTLELANRSVQTDHTGRFLLTDLTPGRHALVIDGTSANQGEKVYGTFVVRVDVNKDKTTTLPYSIWMPRIDTGAIIPIASPTDGATTITTPKIPGLELRIPKGTVIRDRHGNIVTDVGITAIPVNQPPFPLPDIDVPIYFTIQPGGAQLVSLDGQKAAGAQLIYPNYHHAAPGARIDFWNYDAVEKGWYVYGQGTVTDDGTQVVPDAGVAIYEFTGAMASAPPPSMSSGTAPSVGPAPNGCQAETQAGDPVDCATGLFLHSRTDMFIDDVIPLEITRTYRQNDTTVRPFGMGWNFPYGLFLVGPTSGYQDFDLILPDGGRVHYVRVNGGTDFASAIYEHVESATSSASPTAFYKSRMTYNGIYWELTFKNGWVYVFGNGQPLQAIRDPNGTSIKITRSSGGPSGNITRLTSPNGKWIEFTYTDNLVSQIRDVLGRTVSYTYDADSRLTRVVDASGGIEDYTYDTSHRLLMVKDPRTNLMVTNEYDGNGRVMKQTLADGGVFTFVYQLDATTGRVTNTTITDPRNTVQTMSFNSAGYLTSKTFAFGKPEQQTWTYERQPGTNFLLSVTDGLNRKTRYTYDSFGNMLTTTASDGTAESVTTSYTYDPVFHHVTSIRNGLNKTTTLAYDSRGNLVSVTNPLGHTLTISPNSAGLPASVTDTLGNRTAFTYDAGILATVTDPLNRTTRQFADLAGRVKSATDPLGNQVRYTYDNLNRVTHITDALGLVTQMTYDANGNLLSIKDAKNNTTGFVYDAKNRVITRTDALAKAESYVFDKTDNLIRHTDRNGKVHDFVYDSLSRLTQAKYGAPSVGGTPEATVTYTLDAGHRVTQVTDTKGPTVSWVYDTLDRVTKETQGSNAVTYTYDKAHRRTGLTVAGQTAITYTYDDANRLTKITQGSANVSFAYDNASRRSTLTLANGIAVSYSYDNASQLTGLTYKKGTTTLGNLTYAYDPAGRRTTLDGTLAKVTLPTAMTSATYNAANQLTAWGSTTFTYDNNGNMTKEGANTYTWDTRNRLNKTSLGTGTYTYDALNRRSKKVLSGATRQYVYDGDNLVQERNSTNGITANLLTGMGIDETFRRSEGTTSRDFITDALGSTLALTDSTGTTLNTQYTYEPYGKTTTTGTANSNTFQYTGREHDVGSGLYFYRNRYYHPTYGRFISSDPIGFGGGDANLYAYVGGNPVSRSDPLGLFEIYARTIEGLSRTETRYGFRFVPNRIAGVGQFVSRSGISRLDRLMRSLGRSGILQGPTGVENDVVGFGNKLTCWQHDSELEAVYRRKFGDPIHRDLSEAEAREFLEAAPNEVPAVRDLYPWASMIDLANQRSRPSLNELLY